MPRSLINFLRPARRIDAPLLRSVIRRYPRLSGASAAARTKPETAMLKTAIATAAATTLFLTFGVAGAAHSQEALRPDAVRHVAFNRAELATVEGAAATLRRIEVAAGQVCQSPVLQPLMLSEPEARACREQAIADAVARVASPLVTAAQQGRSPRVLIARR